MISQAQLDNWFTYHSPTPDQIPKFKAIREAGRILADAIVANAPDTYNTDAAVEQVRQAVMTANLSIACHPGDTELLNKATSA